MHQETKTPIHVKTVASKIVLIFSFNKTKKLIYSPTISPPVAQLHTIRRRDLSTRSKQSTQERSWIHRSWQSQTRSLILQSPRQVDDGASLELWKREILHKLISWSKPNLPDTWPHGPFMCTQAPIRVWLKHQQKKRDLVGWESDSTSQRTRVRLNQPKD